MDDVVDNIIEIQREPSANVLFHRSPMTSCDVRFRQAVAAFMLRHMVISYLDVLHFQRCDEEWYTESRRRLTDCVGEVRLLKFWIAWFGTRCNQNR